MKYWIGAGLFVYAAVFAHFALARRNQVQTARRDAERRSVNVDEQLDPNSMAAFGEIMTPIVLFALAYVAVKTTFAYYMFNNGQYLSLLDLTGFYAVLIGYGFWLKTKSTYRMPDAVVVAAAPGFVQVSAEDAAPTIAQRKPAHRIPVCENDNEYDRRPLAALLDARGAQPQFGLE
jgi:hypothetical protein